ncbi:helix-turn-helix transcriptional regulator [Sphaerochaeta pleomorpha]|nr:helix-turn-helix domain-containing protein [Sphaerochaeta pleomorpha]
MYYVSMLKGEIQYYNTLSVGQVQIYWDGLMQQASSISEDLANSPPVSNVLKSENRESLESYDLFLAQQAMAKIISGHEKLEEVILYIPSFDLAIGSNSYADSHLFYNAYLQGASMSYEEYNTLIMKKYISPLFLDFSVVTQGGGVAKKTLMIKPLRLIPRGQVYSNVVFLLDRERMHTETTRNIVVFDRNRLDVIYYNNTVPFGLSDVASYVDSNKENVFDKEVEGESYMFATANSDIQNWTYMIYADKETFLAKAVLIQKTFFICLLFCFVTGIAFVLTLTRKSYKRVDTVLRIFEDKPFEGKGDELSYIGDSIVRIQNEKKEKGQFLQSQLILSLVEKQHNQKVPDKNLMASNGIDFSSTYFFVLVCRENEVSEETAKAIIALFKDQGMSCFCFRPGSYTGFLLNVPEKNIEEEYGLISSVMLAVQTHHSLHLYSSDLHYTPLYLSRALTQAQDVLSFTLRSPKTPEPVFYRDMIKMVRGRSFEYSIEVELAIANALKIGDEKSVLETISSVIEVNIEKEITPQVLRFLMLNIAGTVIKVFSRLDEKLFSSYPEINLHPILQNTSIDQVKEDLEEVIHQICEVVSRNVVSVQDQRDLALYNLVVAYIEEHFCDKNMSVSSIADEMNLSAVNLSRLFKKYNRQLISDYINSARIVYAKRLLKEDGNLDIVAEKCGFGSLRTFMRVFKSEEAMTPGNYKDLIKSGKEV